MNFDLSSDQKMLADTVKQFTRKQSTVERFRKLREAKAGWEAETWAHMGELGWLSIPFPEEAGGFGGSFVDVYILLEKLGTSLVPEPYIPSVVLGGMAILRAGSSAQHERWLTPMIDGKATLAFAHAERGNRHAPDVVTTKAAKSGGGWALTGEKVFVLNGHRADQIVVSAQTADGIGLFVVDGNGPGVTRQAVHTIDAHGAAILRLDGATIDDDRRLGEPGEAAVAVVDHVLDYGAAAAVAEGLGVAHTMLEMTKAHLKEREQFGVPIGAFQALQHRAVDMFVEVELLRSMAMLAAMSVDDPDPVERKRAISAAKVKLTTGGRFVAQQAIQLHGGIGITDEHDIGLFFKRMQVLGALFGDEAHHLQRFTELPDFHERT
jgi:alkylation response protein AidB-like acyl-CoA dehydrogenase